MPRVLRYFSKSDESLTGVYVLPAIDLVLLQDVFMVAEDNPMYESFYVGKEQATRLASLLAVNFDLENFDYFLEWEE